MRRSHWASASACLTKACERFSSSEFHSLMMSSTALPCSKMMLLSKTWYSAGALQLHAASLSAVKHAGNDSQDRRTTLISEGTCKSTVRAVAAEVDAGTLEVGCAEPPSASAVEVPAPKAGAELAGGPAETVAGDPNAGALEAAGPPKRGCDEVEMLKAGVELAAGAALLAGVRKVEDDAAAEEAAGAAWLKLKAGVAAAALEAGALAAPPKLKPPGGLQGRALGQSAARHSRSHSEMLSSAPAAGVEGAAEEAARLKDGAADDAAVEGALSAGVPKPSDGADMLGPVSQQRKSRNIIHKFDDVSHSLHSMSGSTRAVRAPYLLLLLMPQGQRKGLLCLRLRQG